MAGNDGILWPTQGRVAASHDHRISALEKRPSTTATSRRAAAPEQPTAAVASVSRVATQNIPSTAGVFTSVIWDTEEADDFDGVDLVGFPSIITLTRPGPVLIVANVVWDGAVSTAGQRYAVLQVNASDVAADPRNAVGAGFDSANYIVRPWSATEGDEVRVMVTQNSGATITVSKAGAVVFSSLTVMYV